MKNDFPGIVHLGVGIDTARYGHHVSFLDSKKRTAAKPFHFDKRKTDPVASLACARFAIVERPGPTLQNPPASQQLRDVVALMEAASRQHTRLVNQLQSLLARVFPELAVHAKHLSAQWVLSLLDKYPTPERLAHARLDTLVKIPHLSA